jgi:hypothetical protein
MKHLFISIISFIIFISCKNGGFKNENGVVFDSKKIVGCYKLDIVEAVKENSNDKDKVFNGVAAELLGGSMSCKINFYENGKGAIHIDTGWLGTLTNIKDENKEFTYALKDDSILVLGNKELIIKTFSDNFDYLLLVDKKENKNYIYNKTEK